MYIIHHKRTSRARARVENCVSLWVKGLNNHPPILSFFPHPKRIIPSRFIHSSSNHPLWRSISTFSFSLRPFVAYPSVWASLLPVIINCVSYTCFAVAVCFDSRPLSSYWSHMASVPLRRPYLILSPLCYPLTLLSSHLTGILFPILGESLYPMSVPFYWISVSTSPPSPHPFGQSLLTSLAFCFHWQATNFFSIDY